MAQEQQHLGLLFLAEAVEPFDALGHRARVLRQLVELPPVGQTLLRSGDQD
ncbi:hypothetical protein [Streptomyces albogriseolus]|uniref:hypothetical protein n=1 Tax=Streptomyces albogriseolus TaxID=1887 RepID=UPI00374FD1D2